MIKAEFMVEIDMCKDQWEGLFAESHRIGCWIHSVEQLLKNDAEWNNAAGQSMKPKGW